MRRGVILSGCPMNEKCRPHVVQRVLRAGIVSIDERSRRGRRRRTTQHLRQDAPDAMPRRTPTEAPTVQSVRQTCARLGASFSHPPPMCIAGIGALCIGCSLFECRPQAALEGRPCRHDAVIFRQRSYNMVETIASHEVLELKLCPKCRTIRPPSRLPVWLIQKTRGSREKMGLRRHRRSMGGRCSGY